MCMYEESGAIFSYINDICQHADAEVVGTFFERHLLNMHQFCIL